jgi:hypothetical protein
MATSHEVKHEWQHHGYAHHTRTKAISSQTAGVVSFDCTGARACLLLAASGVLCTLACVAGNSRQVHAASFSCKGMGGLTLAYLSFEDPPGLRSSALPRMRQPVSRDSDFISTSGVLPMSPSSPATTTAACAPEAQSAPPSSPLS